MPRKIILLVLCLISFESYAQNSKFNIELSYPLPIDDNFLGSNYNGITDLGLRFRFLELDAISIGGSLNIGYFKNSKSDRVQPFDVNLFTIQPRVFAELNLSTIPKFHPSVGLGYSILNYRIANNQPVLNQNVSNENMNESGFNINAGVAYDISDKIIIIVQYDFVKITLDDNVPDITENTNINIFKIGLGYRF